MDKVLSGWTGEMMQVGDAYRVKPTEDGFEWQKYTEKVLKAKGVSLGEVLVWSNEDGQVAMWRDYLTMPPPPAKKKGAKRKGATSSSSSSSSSKSKSTSK
jgi:hypothetical protein